MFCPYCGTQVGDDQHWCTNCGADLSEEALDGVSQQPAVPTMSTTSQNQVGADQAPLVPVVANAPVVEQPMPSDQNGAAAAKMPSKGACIALIIVGFLCGVIWGAIGATQYRALTMAIDQGDVVTARGKARNIRIATLVGVILNVVLVMGRVAGS